MMMTAVNVAARCLTPSSPGVPCADACFSQPLIELLKAVLSLVFAVRKKSVERVIFDKVTPPKVLSMEDLVHLSSNVNKLTQARSRRMSNQVKPADAVATPAAPEAKADTTTAPAPAMATAIGSTAPAPAPPTRDRSRRMSNQVRPLDLDMLAAAAADEAKPTTAEHGFRTESSGVVAL